ncbi:MAG: DNA mismatch repair protein [Bacteroidota bacterium]|nr:DNA mismatch repair protein [Bacteroidota bacterium]MDP4217422.1 DNA mismatch repair protein [Bacteroidota bacterium]MDP4247815.1 DNA mismatch repair protein [Bacteroidota bacterium]MDP4253390.1 DNA mismatch repair protein [Bacteroidota bacterium]MDP4258044.1 DNA mismatch repair protein [Bacteroidota bacterium]
MKFTADKQTRQDLNVLSKYGSGSVYGLFDRVCTRAGARLLDEWFRQPLTTADAINTRSRIFMYFQDKALAFPFDAETIGMMEDYLLQGAGNHGSVGVAVMAAFRKKLMGKLFRNEQFDMMKLGMGATITVLNQLDRLLGRIGKEEIAGPFGMELDGVRRIMTDQRLRHLLEDGQEYWTLMETARYDHLLRVGLHEEMKIVLGVIAHLDVYISVGQIAAENGFSYARALPEDDNRLQAVGLRHPGLPNAVANNVSFDAQNNVLFLTGANMAGKSTFMKTVGVSLYLAHMGFPVAAEEMEFSVREGLYSSINVPDNLSLGLSHFYAEVMRVKQVAEEVSLGGGLLVIFDELFKGTNVKDAYDATLAVTEAFARYRSCIFIISTHIVEVGEALRGNHDNLQFRFFPTVMDGNVPRYPYKLQGGISGDRHGMLIIENERILEIIRQ